MIFFSCIDSYLVYNECFIEEEFFSVAIISLKEKENEDILPLKQQLQLFHDLQNTKKQLEKQQQATESALDEITALHAQFTLLKKKNNEAQSLLSASKKETQAWQLKYDEVVEQLTLANTNAQRSAEESEIGLQVAHQHLAKKMKAFVESTEKIEELESKIQHITEERDLSVNTINELTARLGSQIDQDADRQKELHEKIENAEMLALSWEEKYHLLYGKLQENDLHIQQLELIKDRYQQMESLWKNFGALLGTLPPPDGQENKKNSSEKHPYGISKPYQNLFISSSNPFE